MKQTESVLAYLIKWRSITPREAVSELGVWRLGARVHELREAGHHIITERIEVVNRNGAISRPARYRLIALAREAA